MTQAFPLRRSLPVLLALALAASGCTDMKRWLYSGGFGDRDPWQQPERVIESLAIQPGDRVADLGAGGGYFTFRLAQAAGASGRVFAVDVDEGIVEALREDAKVRDASNVEVVLATPDDSRLAPGSVDLVFTSNTYHHIGDRVAYFGRLTQALSPRGRVAIIEYEPEGMGWFTKSHATAADAIRAEMQAAGYTLAEEFAFLERQSFLVFEPER